MKRCFVTVDWRICTLTGIQSKVAYGTKITPINQRQVKLFVGTCLSLQPGEQTGDAVSGGIMQRCGSRVLGKDRQGQVHHTFNQKQRCCKVINIGAAVTVPFFTYFQSI